jgi:putative Holliday junction resolvase
VSRGRVLGLDLGDARIGVAVSDPDRRLALPFGTVKAGAPQDVKAIAALVADNDISQVVVGHPLSLSGDAGPSARNAETFAEVLKDVLPVPVSLQDERMSTVEAEKALSAAGAKGRKKRSMVDASAATVILQGYLDASS